MKQYGVLCQSCGIEAPAKHVEFYQNIGAVFLRFHKSIKGRLCKRCVHKHFWSMTGTTLAIGWAGYISIVLMPFIVLNNIVRYLGALTMPTAPPGARVPFVTNEVAQRIEPHVADLFARLNAGQDLTVVAREMAPAAGVTPGEIVTYVIMVVAHQRQQQQQQRQVVAPPPMTHGFPVVMPPPVAPPAQ